MCQRTICRDCGKFTWTGCGLHITEVLTGLSLDEICSCDDDRDSEHPWATLTNESSSNVFGGATSTDSAPYTPQSLSGSLSGSQAFTSTTSYPLPQTTSMTATRTDPTGHCIDPSPIEYKLSKISSESAETAISRKAQQAAALEVLRKIKEKKDRELKDANERALNKLLHGLSETLESTE
ncbi:hypothetical protein BGX21_001249 [Mortierella sp. AD011]|nr:hypothetical protein BGX20_001459 [Mortierella sp. AD010]KAF9384677.1 hypothetical protein BGX21_001249 [Mortierella sp. AD011]